MTFFILFEISDYPALYNYLGEIAKDIVGTECSCDSFGSHEKYKPFIPKHKHPADGLKSILSL